MSTANTLPGPEHVERIESVCSVRGPDLLRVAVLTEPAGILAVPGQENPRILIHAGASVRIACQRGDDRNDGVSNYGDIDIIPARMPARWELYGTDRCLALGISQSLLDYVAESSEINPANAQIENRFQMRNPQIEHIGWSIKAEMQQGNPGGRIYTESMATALAVEVLHNRGLRAAGGKAADGRMPSRRLRQILSYIDDNLGDDLTLRAIADECQISVSLLKGTFRKATGISLHQYVIRRRVERAADLLTHHRLTVSEIALNTGFTNQSHLALHMRRLLGVLPKELQNGSPSDRSRSSDVLSRRSNWS